MNNTRYIYTLSCPFTNEIRYVGQTRNLVNRLRKHLGTSYKNPKTNCQIWIHELLSKGARPIIEEVCVTGLEDADREEVFYISLFKYYGYRLTNLEGGGNLNKDVAQSTRKKITVSLTGRKQSEETKFKRSVTNKEVWKDERLRAVQRERTTRLNLLGIIGTKGKPSKKKGKPFQGDREKISISLKEYYKVNGSPKKKKFDNLAELIIDYTTSKMSLFEIARKYNTCRTIVTQTMKENGIALRNDGSKFISKETLISMRIEQGLQIKEVATRLGCSIANVEKFIRIHQVHVRKAA